jgi:hypothetical protein
MTNDKHHGTRDDTHSPHWQDRHERRGYTQVTQRRAHVTTGDDDKGQDQPATSLPQGDTR